MEFTTLPLVVSSVSIMIWSPMSRSIEPSLVMCSKKADMFLENIAGADFKEMSPVGPLNSIFQSVLEIFGACPVDMFLENNAGVDFLSRPDGLAI